MQVFLIMSECFIIKIIFHNSFAFYFLPFTVVIALVPLFFAWFSNQDRSKNSKRKRFKVFEI